MPLPTASRDLSGSPTLLPLPTLFQGGVCGVETRTRLEEELYNRRGQEGQVETGTEVEGGAMSTRASTEETLGMGRILVHIKEEFTRRRGVIAREVSPGLSRASPQRPPPPPTAAGPERVKPWEGALVPVPFLLGRQPEPEPGKAAAEHMGPETTAPPSPPGRVGRQQQRWEGDGKQVAGSFNQRLGINGSRTREREGVSRRLGPKGLRSTA